MTVRTGSRIHVLPQPSPTLVLLPFRKLPAPLLFHTVLVLLALCFALAGCNRSDVQAASARSNRGQMPIPVAVAPAEVRDVPVYLNGLGSVTAFYTVSVKSRGDGQLLQVAIRDGQQGQKGELLAG